MQMSLCVSELAPGHDVGHVLALLLRCHIVGGRVAYGHDGHWLETLGGKQLAGALHVKVAYPAGAQAAFGGSQAEVLGGYSHVYIAMGMLVVGAYPVLGGVLQTHYVERSCGKPFAGITGVYQCPCLRALDDDKLPGLPVAGRRSHAHTFHDVVYVGLSHRRVAIVANRRA